MKEIINNEQTKNKELVYEEGFWTGKRKITYDGIELVKIKRNLYEYKVEDKTETFEVKGNQLFGATITMFGNTIQLARKLTWYEILMSVLVFVPCVLFGAIGGAIGGGLGMTNIVIIRQVDKLYLKITFSVLFAAISILLSYIFAYLVFKFFIF